VTPDMFGLAYALSAGLLVSKTFPENTLSTSIEFTVDRPEMPDFPVLGPPLGVGVGPPPDVGGGADRVAAGGAPDRLDGEQPEIMPSNTMAAADSRRNLRRKFTSPPPNPRKCGRHHRSVKGRNRRKVLTNEDSGVRVPPWRYTAE
jgi:hypothetical protein